eukprot:COSAG01_NODE_8997_length_2588_cov_1.518682_4_plen_62_part_00
MPNTREHSQWIMDHGVACMQLHMYVEVVTSRTCVAQPDLAVPRKLPPNFKRLRVQARLEEG